MALGDVEGDGDLDLVTGESNQRNRLYLNNGTPDPWNGVSGLDITTYTRSTRGMALGDVDNDGDLDLVAGNYGNPNRLHLNNGTVDPWSGMVGSDITPDARTTMAVALGDIDGDGDLDLVTAALNLENRLYLNNGSEDPWSGVSGLDIAPDTQFTKAVAVADVNGDERVDVLAGNDGQVNKQYLNDGTNDPWRGASGSDITAEANSTQGIALEDVDGDGDPDLIETTNQIPQTNRLFLNNGTSDPWAGVAGIDITGDIRRTYSSALGDVDNDGDLDFVTAGGGPDDTRIYLNNGTGDPWNGVTHVVISTIRHTLVALGDVDGDGDLDLIAADDVTPTRLYLNNGTNNPWNGVSGSDINTDDYDETDIQLGDVDGDGDLDLVAINDAEPNRLYLNNGTADPWNGVIGSDITLDANRERAAALGDVDRDGDLDLVVGNLSPSPSRLYLNNGTGDPWNGVIGIDISSDQRQVTSLALGDVDDDGDLDLVTGISAQRTRLYLNNGTADPWDGVTGIDLTLGFYETTDVALEDVDGDGDLDLVEGNFSYPNRLHLNAGTNRRSPGVLVNQITADVSFTFDAAMGDIDGDGDLDLVAGNFNQTNRLYLNNGTDLPWSGVIGIDITLDANTTNGVALGDVDGDGDLDLVETNSIPNPNRLYLNNGTDDPWNGVIGSDISSDGHHSFSLVLGDVDEDGDLDLVVGNVSQPNRLYLNNGTADPWDSVSGADITSDSASTLSLALGDVDGDGDLDLVAGNGGTPNRLYLNNGTSAPWSGVSGSDITSDMNNTQAVALGDVDGDGDLDLVEGNADQANRLYLNNGTADPWNGVVGTDITPDAGDTRALALRDLDNDGDFDLAVGNDDEVNRVYLNNGTSDPWNGVTGRDILPGADNTRALAVGDVNNDGLVDLVAGNFAEPNVLYRAVLFHNARGRATSLEIDTETDLITNATLWAFGSLPPNTGIDFWVSNDGGARWSLVQPGVSFLIPNVGADLRWRAELSTLSPALTPWIDQIEIVMDDILPDLGDRVWEDLDGNGIQDPGEPGIDNVAVLLFDAVGQLVDFALTDANGHYAIADGPWAEDVILKFIVPTGFTFAPQDQGTNDDIDSDVDPLSGETGPFRFLGRTYDSSWDAGMMRVSSCVPPDEPAYLADVTLTTDGNDYPVLHFMDPNQPNQITGYNVYRTSDAGLPKTSWPLVATDIIDMDQGVPNKQWIDTSGDVSPSGLWVYTVTAFNNLCPAEGPF